MGFWHTGYMDFHEPTGIDRTWTVAPPEYPCAQCESVFQSLDDLRRHRFEAHPLRRPVLYVFGTEVGAHPVRVTKPTTPSDVRIDGCDQAVFNGTQISPTEIPNELAKKTTGIVKLVLSQGAVVAEFELDYRIATEAHLSGVETEFFRLAARKRLDTQVVHELIDATKQFNTAVGYVQGISSYLYGVLAKAGAADISLTYEQYEGKFTNASEHLGAYNRPLARTIGSLIEFHFNHFADAAALSRSSRVGWAAARYRTWIVEGEAPSVATNSGHPSQLENLVTDWHTEQILRWASIPLSDLKPHAARIAEELHGKVAEFDKVKLRVLLGEVFAHNAMRAEAIEQAKALRNLPAFEPWAERLIQRFTEERP